MKPFYLEEITTKDGLIHQGIYFKPKKPREKALLWVHGLTGRFYGDKVMMEEFALACDAKGWGFASFNNRGHDQITGMHKMDPGDPGKYVHVAGGAGFEVFEECVFDIHAAVDFLIQQGFSDVVLVGQSTGALKACYAEGIMPHPHVTAVVLIGPISDQLVPGISAHIIQKNLSRMEQLIQEGYGEELQNGLLFFPMTPRRYVSLFKKGSTEEVVDYGDKYPKMRSFRAIKKPLFVIISEKDENLDRPASEVMKVFNETTSSRQYKSFIFPNASHDLESQEKEVVETIVSWVKNI